MLDLSSKILSKTRKIISYLDNFLFHYIAYKYIPMHCFLAIIVKSSLTIPILLPSMVDTHSCLLLLRVWLHLKFSFQKTKDPIVAIESKNKRKYSFLTFFSHLSYCLKFRTISLKSSSANEWQDFLWDSKWSKQVLSNVSSYHHLPICGE